MPRRNGPRSPYYKYDRGWFFLTINTAGRRRFLGDVVGEEFVPSAIGGIVLDAIRFVWARDRESR
jgi:hypothetical protein